jgi:uncharacterized protein (TIGR02285 family)
LSTILLISIWLTTSPAATDSAVQTSAKHYPFIWLHASNNAQLSGISSIDMDGSTASLLFPLVAAVEPKLMEVNFERQHMLLQGSQAVCTGRKIITPERSAIGRYSSVPQLFAPGLRLFVFKGSAYAKSIAANATAESTVSLQQLTLDYPQLIFGAVSARSYTVELDNIMRTMQQQNRLWQRSADDMASGMAQMLANGRVDAIVEYTNIVSTLFADNKEPPFDSYVIAEAPAFINGYILCSGNAAGQLLAQRFSAAISHASQHISYLQAHLKWFPVTEHAAIVNYYNQIYGANFSLAQLH